MNSTGLTNVYPDTCNVCREHFGHPPKSTNYSNGSSNNSNYTGFSITQRGSISNRGGESDVDTDIRYKSKNGTVEGEIIDHDGKSKYYLITRDNYGEPKRVEVKERTFTSLFKK